MPRNTAARTPNVASASNQGLARGGNDSLAWKLPRLPTLETGPETNSSSRAEMS